MLIVPAPSLQNRFAVLTLDTLFFAGKDYAPKAIIDGINIQVCLPSDFTTPLAGDTENIVVL